MSDAIEEGLAFYRSLGSREEARAFFDNRLREMKKFNREVSAMKKPSKGQAKIGKVMHEFKGGDLHSGSKKGPVVKTRAQAVAIAMSEAKRGKRK